MDIVHGTVGVHNDRTVGRTRDNGDTGQIQAVIGIGVVGGQVQVGGRTFINRKAIGHRHGGIVDRRNR